MKDFYFYNFNEPKWQKFLLEDCYSKLKNHQDFYIEDDEKSILLYFRCNGNIYQAFMKKINENIYEKYILIGSINYDTLIKQANLNKL